MLTEDNYHPNIVQSYANMIGIRLIIHGILVKLRILTRRYSFFNIEYKHIDIRNYLYDKQNHKELPRREKKNIFQRLRYIAANRVMKDRIRLHWVCTACATQNQHKYKD